MDELSQGSDKERSEVKDSANSFHITSGPFDDTLFNTANLFSSLLPSRSGQHNTGCLAPTFQGHGLEHFFT